MAKREIAHADLSGRVDWGASVSLDVERMLLGVLLTRPDAFDQVGALHGRQFYEPVHAFAFDLMQRARSDAHSITPARLGQLLALDSRFKDAGAYVDQIMRASAIAEIEGQAPAELARLVADLHLRREVIMACADIQTHARSDGMVTGAELRESLEARLFKADFHGARAGLRSMDAIVDEALTVSQQGGVDLLGCGLAKLDARTGKFERGDLVLIAGRPSMGKSALSSCIALNVALGGVGCIEINGEMSDGQVARRHLSDMAYSLFQERAPKSSQIRSGNLLDSERQMLQEARARLRGLPLVAMKRPAITLGEIHALARRQATEWRERGTRLGFLVVDHVGIIASGQHGLRGVEEVTAISKGLKRMADDLGCVVVALSQLNRKVEEREDKRPTLPDLRESGALEQDADVVIAVYRDAYYAQREPEPKDHTKRLDWLRRKASKEVECIALKVREGAPGTEKLYGDVAHNAIRDDQPAPADGFTQLDLEPGPPPPPPPPPVEKDFLV